VLKSHHGAISKKGGIWGFNFFFIPLKLISGENSAVFRVDRSKSYHFHLWMAWCARISPGWYSVTSPLKQQTHAWINLLSVLPRQQDIGGTFMVGPTTGL
jgi:hypothetical protein